MSSKYDIAALIELIKGLYSRVVSLDLKKRMSAHQQGGAADAGHDIATTLAEDIEKLAGSNSSAANDTASGTDSRPVQRRSRSRPRIDRKNPQSTRRVTELTRFFKEAVNGSTLQPHVGEKLKASVWEHIDTSMRLARKGETVSARLHADVANNALKEAARYMPKEDYNAFYAQVKKRLQEIRANTR